MAVRIVVTPSGRGVRGYFPSQKMGRMIPWESLLERDAILHFEYSVPVLRYEGQPMRIKFLHDGVTRLYIPDFGLEVSDVGNLHIEVKPSAKLAVGGKTAQRMTAITNHYRHTDIGFRILTENELRRQPRLTNLRLLAYHAGRLHSADRQSLVDQLSILPANTIGGAVAVLGDLKDVYRLLADGAYRCDLDCPITPTTIIHRAGKGDSHAPLQF